MLRVSVDKLQPGMVLARPVPLPAEPHRYLLQRDIEIRPDMQRRLKQLGIYVVKVAVEMNADLRVAVLDTRVGVGALPSTEVSFNQRAA